MTNGSKLAVSPLSTAAISSASVGSMREPIWQKFKALTILDRFLFLCYQSLVRDELLKNVSRIVVKLGTGVLTDSRKQLDPAQMQQLVAQLAAQRQAGREIVLVSSGAVGASLIDRRSTLKAQVSRRRA